jgi:basic membrane lipoprotein Med (substrate-binding protein (PBP1-ABC) superfamily)
MDAATPGVHTAVRDNENVGLIGTLFDYKETIPDRIVTSVALNYEDGYVDTVGTLLEEGKLEPKIYPTNVKTGGIVLGEFGDDVPPEVEEEANQVYEDIKSGKIKVDLTKTREK